MGLVLKHIIRTKAGTLHYRRRFPKDAISAIGRGEFKRLLGSTDREALQNYPKVNAEFERLVAEARRPALGNVRTGILDRHGGSRLVPEELAFARNH